MIPCATLDSDSVQTAGQDLAACGMAEKLGFVPNDTHAGMVVNLPS